MAAVDPLSIVDMQANVIEASRGFASQWSREFPEHNAETVEGLTADFAALLMQMINTQHQRQARPKSFMDLVAEAAEKKAADDGR